jgi:hypothetical protein
LVIQDVKQAEDYCVVSFFGWADGMKLREFLDPNIFVLQIDSECKNLEINFNPTPAQVAALRRLHSKIKMIGAT